MLYTHAFFLRIYVSGDLSRTSAEDDISIKRSEHALNMQIKTVQNDTTARLDDRCRSIQ